MKSLLLIFSYTKKLWPFYLIVVVSTIAISLLSLATPFITKLITDIIVASVNGAPADFNQLILWAVLLLVADIVTTLLHNGSGYVGDVMSERMRTILSVRYYDHLLNLSQRYFDTELSGKIINRLNRTITEVTRFINAFANNFGSMLLTVVFVIVILYIYAWELGVMVTILYPLFTWLTMLTSKKWQRYMERRNQQIDIASGRFSEVISQIKVVKSFVQERNEYSRFRKRFNRNVSLTKQQSAYWHKMDIARRIVLNIIMFGMMSFVFVQTFNGRFTIGDMVLLVQLVALVRQPIFGMSFMIEQIQHAITGSKDYFEIMSQTSDVPDSPDAKKLKVDRGEVAFKEVSFGYTSKEPVLKKISFAIHNGERVAFVGESGEGKSTVMSLLLRLYQPDKGEILVDDQDIASVTQASLRRNIAMVFQEPALFSGTIRENIAYGLPNASLEQIESAAKDANALGFISKLEKGLDTEIGERGLKLSGGQKQRIAIARAILKDAPILILDEATSSLDSRAERDVQEALNRLMKGRTTLIIAHRLSTIATVDRIITLRNGQIDEVGTPEELMQTDGIYAQLLTLQTGTSEAIRKRLAKFDITQQ